jgi:hypothetical protein
MPDHTFAIVFRNPRSQRSPMRAKLYLLPRRGSSVHSDCAIVLSAELTARMWSLPRLRQVPLVWRDNLSLTNEGRSSK